MKQRKDKRLMWKKTVRVLSASKLGGAHGFNSFYHYQVPKDGEVVTLRASLTTKNGVPFATTFADYLGVTYLVLEVSKGGGLTASDPKSLKIVLEIEKFVSLHLHTDLPDSPRFSKEEIFSQTNLAIQKQGSRQMSASLSEPIPDY